jgi:beta-1,4-mannosyl-glycoprotein beta-1,4-N-acetylglucosaminyltransferase
MKVVDAFPFYNELDLLEIRLNELDTLVDYFVITEAETTFSGNQKPLYFEENKEKFAKFLPKIVHQVVRDIPQLTPFERDWYQRNKAREVIENLCQGNDFLIYGDLDEIPRATELEKLLNNNFYSGMAHFAQDLFYFYINLMEVSGSLRSHAGEYPFQFNKKWLGTNLSKWDYAQNYSMTELREPSHIRKGIRVKNGGWHFSYIGSPDQQPVEIRVQNKIRNSAHQELNTNDILEKVAEKIHANSDVFSRRRARFKLIADTSFLPDYIQLNIEKYEYLLKK